MKRFFIAYLIIAMLSISCKNGGRCEFSSSCSHADYFDIIDDGAAVVLFSPYDSSKDTIRVDAPMKKLICMSSSHVAALDIIGADSAIAAVSGIEYITNPGLRERYSSEESTLFDIGYESSLDFERIMSLEPDLLITYTVGGAESQSVSKLRAMGVPVAVLHDHLENHPLARAEYVRLFGALTGRLEKADSVFAAVCSRYQGLENERKESFRKDILINIPYGDAWYIPGGDSYMAKIVWDAGGNILGARPGRRESRVISIEQAYRLSKDAEIWLNPGHCRSLSDLRGTHQLFSSFGPLKNSRPIYNNTLRATAEGGNDFWESGSVRPDLVLQDLVNIIDGRDSLTYFFRLH